MPAAEASSAHVTGDNPKTEEPKRAISPVGAGLPELPGCPRLLGTAPPTAGALGELATTLDSFVDIWHAQGLNL